MRRETTIASIQPIGSAYRVTVETSGTHAVIETDLVVHGAGRVPQLSRLALDAANVAYGTRGVIVAGHLQSTNNPAVYAAGDPADTHGMPLTPVAVVEGKGAASNIPQGTRKPPPSRGLPT